MPTIRKRLQNALAGQPVTHPVYVVYDLFNHRWDLDWDMLFGQGLGQINHTNLLEYEFPHLEIKETREEKEGHIHRDVTWITDKGELHEWYIDYWRQEYFVKKPEDYLILARAFSDVKITPTDTYFEASESQLGDRGITFGQLGTIPAQSRSPFQRVQVDFAGLEQFSGDELKANVRQIVRDAGPTRFCLEISEDCPPDWEKTIPAVLEALHEA